ncbi:amino acid transmembrane transporter [Aureococcus anophagefferens]|nr:amino acid transmembrane transporter [Aureococcus anophagefferens]
MGVSALIQVGAWLEVDTGELSKAHRRGKLLKKKALYAPASRISALDERNFKKRHPELAAFLGDATKLLAEYQIKREPYERTTDDGHIDSEIYVLAAFDANDERACRPTAGNAPSIIRPASTSGTSAPQTTTTSARPCSPPATPCARSSSPTSPTSTATSREALLIELAKARFGEVKCAQWPTRQVPERWTKLQLKYLRSLLPGHPMYGADTWAPGTTLPEWLQRRAPGRTPMPEGPALERRRKVSKGVTVQARKNVKIARRDGGLTPAAVARELASRWKPGHAHDENLSADALARQEAGQFKPGDGQFKRLWKNKPDAMLLTTRRRGLGYYALGQLEDAFARGETSFACKPDPLDEESLPVACEFQRFKLNRVARDEHGKPVHDSTNKSGDFIVVDTDGDTWFAYDVALSMGLMEEKLAERAAWEERNPRASAPTPTRLL